MNKADLNAHPNIAFVQPIIPKYRYDFLSRFKELAQFNFVAYCGNIKTIKLKKMRNYGQIEQAPFKVKRLLAPFGVFHLQNNHYIVPFFPGIFWCLLIQRPKVVVTEGEYMMPTNLLIFLYAFLFRARVVWWSLGKVVTRKRTLINTIFDPLIKRQVLSAHVIVGKNSAALEYYHKRYGIPYERMLVAPNTIDDIALSEEIKRQQSTARQFREKQPGSKIVLYVGALERTKRLENLLDAMEIVWEDHPEAFLYIVGDGDIREDLEKTVKERGRKNNVIFTGKVTEGVSRYFLMADVFVLPSLGGLAIPHAMLHGIPVIAGRADGTEKDLVIDSETGFLMKRGDAQEISENINKILVNPALKARLGQNGFNLINSSWNISLQVKRFQKAIEIAMEEDGNIRKRMKTQ